MLLLEGLCTVCWNDSWLLLYNWGEGTVLSVHCTIFLLSPNIRRIFKAVFNQFFIQSYSAKNTTMLYKRNISSSILEVLQLLLYMSRLNLIKLILLCLFDGLLYREVCIVTVFFPSNMVDVIHEGNDGT